MKRSTCLLVLAASSAWLIAVLSWAAEPADPQLDEPGATPQQIEADWLHHDQMRRTSAISGAQVKPEEDAPGGVDGVKDGKWGFHTENEDNPWWQVDLQKPTGLDRMVLYNRCDQCGARNSRIIVLASDDAESWKQLYQHDGTVFYGHSDNKPLSVGLDGVTTRYIRLQLPQKSYFHLDEVEIYAADSGENVALGKPATQSSTSQWSVRHAVAGAAKQEYGIAQVLQRGFK